jgi:hypothetical protein
MAKSRLRQQQLLISAIGAAIILPSDLFLGVMFAFSFRAGESAWAWGFDLIAFWSQIIGIIASFFKPRLAAGWMLACIGISVLIGIGFEVKSSYAPDARHVKAAEWLGTLPAIMKTAGFFWGVPLICALLLIRTGAPAKASAHRHPDPQCEN